MTTLHADLDGVLSASRNFSALASQLPTLHTRAIGTLRRRLPVQARRDIQAEYQVGARRLTQDLQARPTEDGLRLVGRFRGIGLRNFAARQTRRGVTAAVLRGKRSLREHAFFGVGVNRNAQVFRREGAKREMQQGRYAGKRRQPLVAEYGATHGPMVPSTTNTATMTPPIQPLGDSGGVARLLMPAGSSDRPGRRPDRPTSSRPRRPRR